MADDGGASVSGSSKEDKTENYDPRLDFFSDKFDPLLALRTSSIKVPDVSARRYDNLAFYHSATDKEQQVAKETTAKTSKSKNIDPNTVERRWEPHQMPIRSEVVRNTRNVLTRMETIEGPLALLRKCKDERLKIKVVTRHAKGIRGYCLGYVTAFDKHWNITLEDVTEVWTRPKKRKVPALDSVETGAIPKKSIRPPEIIVTPHETNKKLENCTRKVDQFLMRGEHVVLISLSEEPNIT